MDKQTQKELLQIVEKNYEDIAEQFDETRKKHLWPELINWVNEVPAGAHVLDVGCGNGRLLEAFRSKGINYLGVDKSNKLIDLARVHYQQNKFLVGDILELSKVPEINFDYIFCIAVLQHIPGKNLQIDVLKQLRSKMNENGKIFLAIWNMWSQEKFRRLILKFILLKLIKKNKMDIGDVLFDWKNAQGMVVSKRYYHAFRKRELKSILKKAGFKIDKLYHDKYNYYCIASK